MNTDYLLLQINDGMFPIGSYTQSYGLETYIQKGIVHNEETAHDYIKSVMEGNFFYNDLLSCYYSYQHAANRDLDKVFNIDSILQASKTPKEIRSASEKLAVRFIKTIDGIGLMENDLFESYCSRLRDGSSNYCVAYGVLCASLSINMEAMLKTYVYSATAAIVSNCVKMIPLSQIVGQKVLFKYTSHFSRLIQKLAVTGEELIGLSTPAFDIRCMQHETLYSRLYMS